MRNVNNLARSRQNGYTAPNAVDRLVRKIDPVTPIWPPILDKWMHRIS